MRPLTARRPKVMLPVGKPPDDGTPRACGPGCGYNRVCFCGRVRGAWKSGATSATGRASGFTSRMPRSVSRWAPPMPSFPHRIFVTGPFLAVNGDMILTRATDIARMTQIPAPCMGTSTTDHPGDFGVVIVENNLVTALEEKSKQPKSSTINAGAYLFTPAIFELLARVSLSSRGELGLTDALNILIGDHRLRAVPSRHGWTSAIPGTCSMQMRPSLQVFLRRIRELSKKGCICQVR